MPKKNVREVKLYEENAVVLRGMAKMLLGFYAAAFLVAAVLGSAFGVAIAPLLFQLAKPSDCSTEVNGTAVEVEGLDPSCGGAPLAAWLVLVLSHVSIVAVVYWVVRCPHVMAWDYALSMIIIHAIVSIAVSGEFPTNWIWWVTVLPLAAGVSLASEYSVYKFRELADIKVDH